MNNPDTTITQLLHAITFAEEAHRGQVRKGEGNRPYIGHPLAVMHTLWQHGVRETAVLCAAVLHDVLEDTPITPAELTAEFGAEIVGLVQELTDDKSLPQAERKRLQIVHAPHKSQGAARIKLADKLCNVRDVAQFPPEDWSAERRLAYVAWAAEVVAGLRPELPSLEAVFAAAVAS
jgi:GTP diphosphokinase / guanosine-3',5'-bis(diphosphate) 3'-diphosphatase